MSLSGLGSRLAQRRRWRGVAGAVIAGGMLASCVTVELPTIAHVHVGHVVTAWVDTPGQRALFDVALAEAAIATEHAAYAVDGARDVAAVRLHLGHVLHAVDPVREPAGPGTGYGLAKAIGGCDDHLGFALEVRDASANLKAGMPAVIGTLRPLRDEARAIAALAAEGRGAADAATALAYAQEARQRAARLAGELWLARHQLAQVVAAEQPPYRVVARRYLFGIIRLPSGEWAFDNVPGAAAAHGGYR